MAPSVHSELTYPAAPRDSTADTIHGHVVADPYRWLENPDSERSRAWLAAQDTLCAEYLAALPGREWLAGRLTELLATGAVSPPVWRGDRAFYVRRNPGQEHPVLYTAAAGDSERVLVDPMSADPSGATTLDSWEPSHDGRLLACQLSHGGTEEAVLRVLDVGTGEPVDGPIDRVRVSPVAWRSDGSAFYYVRRLAPSAVPEGEAQYHRRVYLHRVGAPPDEDVLVFGEGRDKTSLYSLAVSPDGRWLVVGAAQGTAPRNDVWVADLAQAGGMPDFREVLVGADAWTEARVGWDGQLYLRTNHGAPRGRLAVADPARPAPGAWSELLPADPVAVLTEFTLLSSPAGGTPRLLACWARWGIGELSVHDAVTGRVLTGLTLPGLGTVSGLSARPEGGSEAWFTYTDDVTPATVYRYDAGRAETEVWARPPGAVSIPGIVTRLVSYPSADGTKVPLRVIARADGVPELTAGGPAADAAAAGGTPGGRGAGDIQAGDIQAGDIQAGDIQAGGVQAGGVQAGDIQAGGSPAGSAQADSTRAPRPTVLYGYGGFNIARSPAFSAEALAWVEAGGVYAVAGLRGGNEGGEDWHRAGMREHKQNVFDDMHAAAQWLTDAGWTTPEQLCVAGGSNGGLLVGAVITQRPERYAAALCLAPLLDMVRYERFGLGRLWTDEFGTVADPEQSGWLLSYSPYHHVREGTRYPAVLFSVFEGDTRVDPLHARKMCAALQHATGQRARGRPVLLRRERDVGHGARAVSRAVALSTDRLAFAAAHTGLRLPDAAEVMPARRSSPG